MRRATAGLNTMDSATPHSLQQIIGLSPSSSTSSLSDTRRGRKRNVADTYEKALERRLRRKIKNKESVARSRARCALCRANDICKESKRQIINAEDIFKALEETEFPEFICPLKALLEEVRRKNAGKKATVSKGKGNETKGKGNETKKKRKLEGETSDKGEDGDNQSDERDEDNCICHRS